MEHATSKQLWKLQSLASERARLMTATGTEGEILTELSLPLPKDNACRIIDLMIKANEQLQILLDIKTANEAANKVYGEQDA